jgi:hypothetical protein
MQEAQQVKGADKLSRDRDPLQLRNYLAHLVAQKYDHGEAKQQ